MNILRITVFTIITDCFHFMLFHWNGRMKRPLLSRPNEILWLGFDILIWWWNADVEWWGEEVSACSDKCKLARLQLQSIPAPTCRSVPLYPIFSGKWKYFRVQQRVVDSHCLRTLDLLRSDWLISWTGYIQNPVVLLPCLKHMSDGSSYYNRRRSQKYKDPRSTHNMFSQSLWIWDLTSDLYSAPLLCLAQVYQARPSAEARGEILGAVINLSDGWKRMLSAVITIITGSANAQQQ